MAAIVLTRSTLHKFQGEPNKRGPEINVVLEKLAIFG